MFPIELERDAFRTDNGEFGWTRAQISGVVEALSAQGIAILGGELWWVRDGTAVWEGCVPQRDGPPSVYAWVTERRFGEPWQDFVARGVSDALAAVVRWPQSADLPPDLAGRILYNLTWISEADYPPRPKE
jgi:hypothetical protein